MAYEGTMPYYYDGSTRHAANLLRGVAEADDALLCTELSEYHPTGWGSDCHVARKTAPGTCGYCGSEDDHVVISGTWAGYCNRCMQKLGIERKRKSGAIKPGEQILKPEYFKAQRADEMGRKPSRSMPAISGGLPTLGKKR